MENQVRRTEENCKVAFTVTNDVRLNVVATLTVSKMSELTAVMVDGNTNDDMSGKRANVKDAFALVIIQYGITFNFAYVSY